MTDEEINVTIAEACGILSKDQWGKIYKTPQGYVRDVPDYLNDLNACAEFEATLTYEEAEAYEDELCDICKRDNELEDNPAPWRFAVATAKPKQRCLAFLKTKGILP